MFIFSFTAFPSFLKKENIEHFPFSFLKDKKAYGFIHSNLRFVTLQSQHKLLYYLFLPRPNLPFTLSFSLPLQNI